MSEEKIIINEDRIDSDTASNLYEDAADKIAELFGDGAENNGFEGLADPRTIGVMKGIAIEISHGRTLSANIRINERVTAKISLGTKGIKVERRETKGAAL